VRVCVHITRTTEKHTGKLISIIQRKR